MQPPWLLGGDDRAAPDVTPGNIFSAGAWWQDNAVTANNQTVLMMAIIGPARTGMIRAVGCISATPDSAGYKNNGDGQHNARAAHIHDFIYVSRMSHKSHFIPASLNGALTL